jgi:hypothetical protein
VRERRERGGDKKREEEIYIKKKFKGGRSNLPGS